MEQETEPPIMQNNNDTNEEDSLPITDKVEMAVQKLKKHIRLQKRITYQQSYLNMVEMN